MWLDDQKTIDVNFPEVAPKAIENVFKIFDKIKDIYAKHTKMNKKQKHQEDMTPQQQIANTANTVTSSAKTVFGINI